MVEREGMKNTNSLFTMAHDNDLRKIRMRANVKQERTDSQSVKTRASQQDRLV